MTQPLALREQVKILEHLQELDLKIDQLKKRKEVLPAALRALDESCKRSQTTIEAKKNNLLEVEKVQRQTQAAIELNQERLTRANQKLELVQNSQEFQAASKEIEQLRKLQLSLEEQVKKSKQEIEVVQAEVEKLNMELSQLKDQWQSQNQIVSQETGLLDEEMKGLVEHRNQYVAQLDRRLVAQYDRIRAARGGLGIVPATGGRCSGCNMMLPPQLFNQVQRAVAIQMCPSCNRILFAPELQNVAAS